MNEKNRLEKAVHNTVLYNRNHFMNCREPRDMLELIKAGITDDFSLICRYGWFSVRYLQTGKVYKLETRQLTDLRLHSLNIMDRTLSDKRYMYMNSFDAMQYCTQLINNVEQYNGEITLLWHNNLVEKSSAQFVPPEFICRLTENFTGKSMKRIVILATNDFATDQRVLKSIAGVFSRNN